MLSAQVVTYGIPILILVGVLCLKSLIKLAVGLLLIISLTAFLLGPAGFQLPEGVQAVFSALPSALAYTWDAFSSNLKS